MQTLTVSKTNVLKMRLKPLGEHENDVPILVGHGNNLSALRGSGSLLSAMMDDCARPVMSKHPFLHTTTTLLDDTHQL